MNVLITGATGLIGSALTNKLLQENHRVTALTRDPISAQMKLGSHGEQLSFITSLAQLGNLNNFNACINLAGEPIVAKRWTVKQKRKLEASRWNITHTLVDLIQHSEHPPSVFISGSAVGYYGKQGNQKITENIQPFHQDFSHRLCANWEEIALKADSEKPEFAYYAPELCFLTLAVHYPSYYSLLSLDWVVLLEKDNMQCPGYT